MFAKGPMPGATPRDDFLSIYPGATCKKECLAYGMVGFTVYLADGTLVITRGNPKQAWEEALSKLQTRAYNAKYDAEQAAREASVDVQQNERTGKSNTNC